MLSAIREDVTRSLSHIRFTMMPPEDVAAQIPAVPDFVTTHLDPMTGFDNSADRDASMAGLISTRLPPLSAPLPDMPADLGSDPAEWEGKVGRNAVCPCGSGRKFKHCHGQLG
jgi:preprotein translocase subunit SecA